MKPARFAWFWAAAAALLALMGGLELSSALQENQTYDEAAHLAAGYAYLKTGAARINVEHPPLAKLLAALPLLALDPQLPREHATNAEQMQFGDDFLYGNRVPADTLLLAGRAVTMLVSLAFGLALALWTRRRFGDAAALAALLFYCLDPNILAHGRYVTTDVPMAAVYFLTCAAWAAYLESGRRRELALSGLALGLALCTKFSAATLLFVMAALYGVHWWQHPKRHSLWGLTGSLGGAGVIAVAVIAAVYWPETRHSWNRPLESELDITCFTSRILYVAGVVLHLPAHAWLIGLNYVASHNKSGHDAYLLGQFSRQGWWYYFPVAFAVKSTAAALIAACIALLASVKGKWRAAPFTWYVLAIPPLIFFAASVTSRINIGLRHILPVYPFLYIASAAVLVSWKRKRWAMSLLALLAGLHAAESLRIYPHYLAFFNFAAGGPESGPRYLLDSNLDWGQDLKNLKAWTDAHGVRPLPLVYFGRAQASYYGLETVPLEPGAEGYVAASATPLYGLYERGDPYGWLRRYEPVARIGYSIYVYRLTRK
ncbi:MAG: glycosyltransferase family 39 protein [Bryobacteraceae bacterium]